METLFGDWTYETFDAKDLKLIPNDCVSPITSVKFGKDRIAFASSTISTIYYSLLSEPDSHTVKLDFEEDEIIRMEWLGSEPFPLLVILKKSIVVIDTEKGEVQNVIDISSFDKKFVDAHWMESGGIIILSKNTMFTIYDSTFQQSKQIDDFNGEESYSFKIDGNNLLLCQKREIKILQINDDQISFQHSFVASPSIIQNILVLRNHWVITSDFNITLWDKNEIVPLFSVKAKSNQFFASYNGAFGVEKLGDKSIHFIKIAKGRKADLVCSKSFHEDTETIKDADWMESNNPDEECLAFSTSCTKFCAAYILKFVHNTNQ